MIPPKPKPRPDNVPLWRYAKLFRQDILSAQPARLYRAWMAEFRTPFFRSYMINQPDLIDLVLKKRPKDFPKSDRVGTGLRPVLGESVFVTNGETWERQRRIIDPAFEGGRLKEAFPAMQAAAQAAVDRLATRLSEGETEIEIEAEASHAAADVIFRTLFSIPIEDQLAQEVFQAFRAYQRSQPILNLAALARGSKWMPRLFRPGTRRAARHIRSLIWTLCETRMVAIQEGRAPQDLATKIMTTRDPESGETLSTEEMVDQVAIFFLAGHETSASALSWALYLLGTNPEWQSRVAKEASAFDGSFAGLSSLRDTRDVFRETLRLYPPVPMMVREATKTERFRARDVAPGSQVVLSPWHLHRHETLWENPDGFDPARWQTEAGRRSAREAYLPFSAGPRVCTGAGFAMAEGVLLLGQLVGRFHFEPGSSGQPIPEAHLTVRSRSGIWLNVTLR